METTKPEIEIVYYLSQEYRDDYFAENGERPDRRQKTTFQPEELSEEARKKVLKEGSMRGGPIYLKLELPKLKVSRRGIGEFKPSTLSDTFYVSEWPKTSSTLFVSDEPIGAGDVAQVIDDWKARKAEMQEEYEQHLSEALARVIGKMEENRGTVEEDSYTRPLVLKSGVLNALEGLDGYDRLKSLQEEARSVVERIEEYKERRKEKKKQRKQKERERRKSEREDWIQRHGSEHLQEARQEGYNCQRRYVIERARQEYSEEFYVDFDKEHEYKDRSCPSEEALRFAQERGGKVVWLVSPGKEKPGENRRRFEPCEAVRKRVTMGEHGKSYTLISEFAG